MVTNIEPNTWPKSISDNTGLSQTANLPEKLKLCVGEIKRLYRRSKQLCSIIYMKSDEPKAGNSLKDRKFCGEVKECVPIPAREKRFPLKKGKTTVIAQRKQFLLMFGHAITVHKSQGSTLAYIQGDLNRSTGIQTETGKNYEQPLSQGQFYTLFSDAKGRENIL